MPLWRLLTDPRARGARGTRSATATSLGPPLRVLAGRRGRARAAGRRRRAATGERVPGRGHAADRARRRRVDAPLIVSGDGEGLVDLAGIGALDGGGVVLYSGTFAADPPALRVEIAQPATRCSWSPTRTASAPGAGVRSATRTARPNAPTRRRSPTTRTTTASTCSPTRAPTRRPWSSRAGRRGQHHRVRQPASPTGPRTAGPARSTATSTPRGRSATTRPVIGERIRIDLDEPSPPIEVNLVQPLVGPGTAVPHRGHAHVRRWRPGHRRPRRRLPHRRRPDGDASRRARSAGSRSRSPTPTSATPSSTRPATASASPRSASATTRPARRTCAPTRSCACRPTSSTPRHAEPPASTRVLDERDRAPWWSRRGTPRTRRRSCASSGFPTAGTSRSPAPCGSPPAHPTTCSTRCWASPAPMPAASPCARRSICPATSRRAGRRRSTATPPLRWSTAFGDPGRPVGRGAGRAARHRSTTSTCRWSPTGGTRCRPSCGSTPAGSRAWSICPRSTTAPRPTSRPRCR